MTRANLVGILSGAVEVHGPGVKLVVDDAKEASSGGDGDPRETSGFSDTGRVRDRDMQRVVNGLWQLGRGGHLDQRAAADGAVRDPCRG